MGTAFLYGNGGSGGTGATLTVTAPAGATVTVSKDGKTKTRTAGADGVAVFKGLSTGEWTVTITDGGQTASKVVTVTADYAVSITFFAATINVTYPAGSVCTATDGVTTLAAPDTSGTWACVVPNAGTWTVKAKTTDGNKTKEATVDITTEGQIVSVKLSYKLLLYKSGNEYADITGGWYVSNKAGSPTLTKNSDNMTITMPESSEIAVATKSTINFSEYSTLKIKFRRLEYKPRGYRYWGTTSYYTQLTVDSYSAVVELNTAVDNIVSCDISTINITQFAKLVISGLDTGGGILTTIIEEIWAE